MTLMITEVNTTVRRLSEAVKTTSTKGFAFKRKAMFINYYKLFSTSFIPCGNFGSPYLGKATAAAGAALSIPNDACGIFEFSNKGIAASAWDL